jgi:hypothetical protein
MRLTKFLLNLFASRTGLDRFIARSTDRVIG